MHTRNLRQSALRLTAILAAERFLRAAARLSVALKENPYWHLQPRVPGGSPDGGQWLAGLLSIPRAILPRLRDIAAPALQRLLREARRLAPVLRRIPRRWDDDRQPADDSYDKETRRIGNSSWQRRGEPNIRFRTEEELRRYLGPAGKGREWHHIVEKRLAGRPDFPPEKIHSTDNIISLPVEVHRRISAKTSARHSPFSDKIRRIGLEKLGFAEQYDHGLTLIEETLQEFGYDTQDF